MANRQVFGRRINTEVDQRAQPTPARPIAAPKAVAVDAPPPGVVPVEEPPLDLELQAWKQARGSQFKMPWSQLSLMASLCFGIASFVLPDSVNSNVDWLLWGLSAVSAFVWFSNRRKKKLKDPAAPRTPPAFLSDAGAD
jgi:hypothetical protein